MNPFSNRNKLFPSKNTHTHTPYSKYSPDTSKLSHINNRCRESDFRSYASEKDGSIWLVYVSAGFEYEPI